MKIASLFFIFFMSFGVLFVPASNAGAEMPVKPPTLKAPAANNITGFVYNDARVPLADIHVELLTDLYVTITRTKTNGSGLFAFRGLPDGQFHVRVLPYGTDYEGQTRAVSLISISAMKGSGGASEQIEFYLKAKKNTTSGPLAAPGVVFAQEVPDAAKKLYENGVADLSDKKESEGFEKLKKALEIFPNYFLALDRLGTEYVMRGHYRPAFVLLTKAVEVNPRSFSSLFGLGLAQFRLQQIDAAINNLKRATELYKDSPNAFMWLGIALQSKSQLTQAQEALLQANKLSKGESSEVHWQLARLYKEQGRFHEAADELELFLKYDPNARDTDKIKETIKSLRQKASK